jgi:drug/metabolite transporter (DMT)-like permease
LLPTPVSFIIAAGSTSVETGGSTSIPVRVSPENGFNQSVQLTCANLPTQATCTFAASTIAAGGGTTTMKLATMAPSPCGSTTPYGQTSSLPYTGPVLAGLLIFLLPKRRRALKTLVTLIAMAGVIAITGCGACTDLGTRPGTYTIQITGTSMGSNQITVTQNVQITVTE